MILVVILILFFISPVHAHASSNSVVIINQVRGEECCEVGSFDNLKRQVDTTTKLNQLATYALRYDSLLHENTINLLKGEQEKFPKLIQLGGFLEITPNLAKDAGVDYLGSAEDWYKTSNVYTPGYSQSDREAILDTYMAKYHKVFGEYPELTVGWFMDTYSLNYLRDKYGVLVHELTREQWGTDSYTLSGGPIHYPFVSSRKWSFIPGKNGITIIRQTVTDPRFNYGDHSSTFTSQPNDYGKNKGFDYFEKLIWNAFNQPGDQVGYAVIGLENSMELKYQDEYVKQLEHIASKYPNTRYLDPSEIVELSANNVINIYSGDDAYWITTNRYRIRLIVDEQKVMITDFRIYDENLGDPYESTKVSNTGYFIAPYVVDGSRWFKHKQHMFKQLIDPQFNEGYGAKNERETIPSQISLPPIKKDSQVNIQRSGDNLKLSYDGNDGVVTLNFGVTDIKTEGIKIADISFANESNNQIPVEEVKSLDEYSLKWHNKESEVLGLKGRCKDETCVFTPFIDVEKFKIAQNDQSFLLLPTTMDSNDTSGSLIYPSLNYLILGRSPARVVVLPRNKEGIPVKLSEQVKFEHRGLTLLSDPNELKDNEAQFYDFETKSVGKYEVLVEVPGTTKKSFNFYFVSDCRNNIKHCLSNPIDLYRFIRAVLGAKFAK